MTYCLWCDEELIVQMNWKNIVINETQSKICHLCNEKLKEITGKRCNRCSRRTTKHRCVDCIYWYDFYNENDPLERNYSLFKYNEFIQDVITKWKYRGDYVIAEMFRSLFHQNFQKQFSPKEMIIVPIPLSKERKIERGFNQAQQLASFINDKPKSLLERIHTEKQSKRTKRDRIAAQNPFKVNVKVNKPVVLVDDIYTTGTTIRHAAMVLKASGCPAVYAYTLIRG